jgi:hypothetical protein
VRLRYVALTTVALAVPALALGASGSTVKLEAALSGRTEVPKGDPNGSGTAAVGITGTKVCWQLTYKNIVAPTAAHIHRGSAGKAGPVVVPLGAKFTRKGCGTAPAALARAIGRNPAGYYVNIHNARYPGGAIRGQLKTSGGGGYGTYG